VPSEPYNDSAEAHYSRTLDERSPHTRSSVAFPKATPRLSSRVLAITLIIGAIAALYFNNFPGIQ